MNIFNESVSYTMRQKLVLKDDSIFSGTSFGYPVSISGEVVFNTGMVGYPETLTAPSYKNQILVFTYPLIGNYGVPPMLEVEKLPRFFESKKIHLKGIVVSEVTHEPSHWNAQQSLSHWLNEHKIASCAVSLNIY